MKKIFPFLLMLTIIATISCRAIRERKSAHHQPFNTSREKKPQHKKHKGGSTPQHHGTTPHHH